MAFHPYLSFGGQCREAFTAYHEIFGGDLIIMSGHEAPPGTVPDEALDLTLHASLKVGETLLLASDTSVPEYAGMQGIFVHWVSDSVADAQRIFAALMEGGEEYHSGEQFWTPWFGSGVDRWGVPWEISVYEGAA